MFGLDKIIAVGSAGLALVGVLAVLWLSHDLGKTRVDRDYWKGAAQTWEKAATDWKRAFESSEKRRKAEHDRAVKATTEANGFCDKRVAQARKDGFSLASLLNKEPKREPNGCAIRALLPADELRSYINAPIG